MMDYTGRGISEDGQENHDELSSELGRGPLVAMAQAGLAAEQTQIVGPDNVVRLPAGVSLDALAVDGRDLIITLEDGSVIRIPDGAIIVPQFEVDGVSVPPQNIAALLTGSEPEPAAGSVQSSGGNFAGDVGDIQDAYALGDLLPYTELSFPETREEEIFPGVVNDPPVIVIVTPDNPAGAIAAIASVDEAGLPARTVDGIAESAGTASETDVETTTGTIVFDAPDGAAAVLINDVAITAIGQTFVSPFGTLTITSIDLAGGRIGFSYTLADNLLGETVDGFFTMTIVDTDGDRASATLQIEVINDTPIARDDSAAQDSESAPVTVDVFANDTPGADGVALSTIQFVDGTLSGTGTLVNNGDGTFTYTPGPGEEGNVTFDYTITDGDNDTARATVTISLVPDTVPTGGLVTATVDDDGLVGGNPNSTTGDLDANVGDDAADTSEASFTGTLAFNVGVDAPASVAFDPALNGATATIGTEQVTYSLAGNVLTATGPRGVLFTVELTNAATGEYQVTLVDNVLHAGGPNDEAIDATTAIGFIVTDSDGDSVATTLNIVFDDDAPTAFDNVASVEEGGTVGGNLLSDGTDDVPGADGFAGIIGLTSINTESGTTTVVDGNLVIQGQYGTLTVNATTGVYSYVSTPNSTNTDATDTFTYTIVDGDGDTSTATLTVGIDNVAGNVSDNDALVNEAGLPGGSDSASNSEIANGQITVSDAVGPFVYTLTGSSDGTYGTLVLNEDTGAYTYTLDTPFTDGDTGENSRNVVNGADSFAYEVHDTAGNLIGSGTINVSIIDDIPDAVDELALAVVEGDPTGLSGNVIDNDVEGADGASVTSVNIDGTDYPVAAAGTTSVMTANGTYTFDALGNWTFAPSAGLDQTNGPIDASFTYTLTDTDDDFDTAKQPITINDGKDPSAGDPISLTVDDENLADGSDPATPVTDAASIVFTEGSDPIVSIIFDDTPTALDNLGGGLTWERVSDTQIVGRSGADTIVTLDLSVVGTTATVTVTLNDNYALHPNLGDDLAALGSVLVVATDLDGDQASSSVSVSVSDDLPTANAGVELTGSVDEDALPGGIEGGPGDIDGGAGTVGLTTGGSVATLFNSGADSPLTYAFETAASTQTYLTGLGLTSGGVALSYVVSAGSIVATAGGSPVFTMTLSSTGTWQFTLEGVLDHAGDDSEDDIDIDFGNLVVATDDDGDSVTGTGSLVVTVDDDTPVAFSPTTASVNNTAGPVSSPIALNFDAAAGADDVGDVVFNITNGTPLLDTNGNALKLAGEALFLQNVAGSDGHVVEARTADGDLAFTATLNPGGDSYTIDLDGTIYNSEQFSFTDLSGTVGGGNVNYKGLGIGSGGTQDILISGNGSVNTNSTEIGIASGNDVGAGDVVRFDLVSNLAVEAAAPSNGNTGFTHTGHYEVASYIQKISFVQGGGSNTTGFTVTIRNGDNDFTYLGDPTGETAPPDITVRVYSSDPATGGTLLATFTDTDNSVVVTGVKEGNYIQVTSSDPFSIVEYSDQTGRPFKLGAIEIETANTLNPFDLNLPITATDGDGDSVDSSITVHLNPVVAPVVLDLDGAGNEFASSSANLAYDYDGDGAATATAWIGKGSAILAHDANGDGMVNDASEFVFGGNGITDLEAIAATHDSNEDGVLDARDAAYGSFGVWIDADLDATFDAGEFVSLADAGIASINLVSDGLESQAADGSVTIFGQTTFTWADGSTGEVADTAFRTGVDQVQASVSTATLDGSGANGSNELRQDYRAFELAAIAAGAGFAMHQSFEFGSFAFANALDLADAGFVPVESFGQFADFSVASHSVAGGEFGLFGHSATNGAGFEARDFGSLTPEPASAHFADAFDQGLGNAAPVYETVAQPFLQDFAQALPMAEAMAGMEQLLLLANGGVGNGQVNQEVAVEALAQLAQDVGIDDLIDHFAAAAGEAPVLGAMHSTGVEQLSAFLDLQVGPQHAGGLAVDILHDAAAMADAVSHA